MSGDPIWISGGTGLVGGRLTSALLEEGRTVNLVTRRPQAMASREGVDLHEWNGTYVPAESLADCAAAVHLAGEPLFGGLATRARLERVRASRVESTRALVAALGALPAGQRPRTLVCASAVGFYGDRGEEAIDESSPAGKGFLAELCRDWEAEAARARDIGMRVVELRIGVVLAREGGALAPLLPVFGLGLGGPLGGGRQWFPWIHIDDLVGAIQLAISGEALDGPTNATSPEPVRQAEFAKALGRALGRPAVLPTPAFAVRLGLGDVAGELLDSRRVLPQRLLGAGFEFRLPHLDDALAEEVAGP